jgi:hypothetical protein
MPRNASGRYSDENCIRLRQLQDRGCFKISIYLTTFLD